MVSSDCVTVYLGQGVFLLVIRSVYCFISSSSALALELFCLHYLKRANSSERLVTLNVGQLVQHSHLVASECVVLSLYF